jgi:hypothetical protein
VFDLQILELVDRHVSNKSTKMLSELGEAIDKYRIAIPDWNGVKVTNIDLSVFERGFFSHMVKTRPLVPYFLASCTQAVALLHDLETAVLSSIGVSSLARDAHRKFVGEASSGRVTDSQREEYNPLVVMRNIAQSRITFHNRGF